MDGKPEFSPSITIAPYGITAHDEVGKKMLRKFAEKNQHRIRTFDFQYENEPEVRLLKEKKQKND